MKIDRIGTISDDLKQAKSAEEYWNKCLSVFDSLGVTGIGYGVIPIRPLVAKEGYTNATFFRHTYSREWERAVGKEQLLDADLSTELMLAGTDEVFWNDEPEKFGATYQNRNLHQLEHDLGMIWGKTLLLSHHSVDPVSSGIGLHVSCVNSDAEFEKYWSEFGPDLKAIASLLDVGMLGQHCDGIVRLTGREKDYIFWSAMGLDRIETAEKLGISEHTLNKPIASAKAKLKARNTSQAVAKAVLLGLVDL